MPMGQPFIPKSRRTPSMIGGPPKATLGGPNRKVSPMPPTVQAAAIAEKLKAKKIPVKLPAESEEIDLSVEGARKSLWTRSVSATYESSEVASLPPPSITTGAVHPDESHKTNLPDTIDICLPLPVSENPQSLYTFFHCENRVAGTR